jgi:hypothetical protein
MKVYNCNNTCLSLSKVKVTRKYVFICYNLLDSLVRSLLLTTAPLPALVKAFRLTLYTEYGSRTRYLVTIMYIYT